LVRLLKDRGENQSDIRATNLAVVLDAIRRHGAISRTELAQLTRLTPSAVTNITRELADLHLVRESGLKPAASSGRKQVKLTIDNRYFAVIGVDIARTHVQSLLVQLTGGVLARAAVPCSAGEGPERLLALAGSQIEELQKEAKKLGLAVLGIGIGIPGPVDTSQGIVTSPPNFPGWRDFSLRRWVEQRFHLPVCIDDDAKAAALGESWFGAGQGLDSIVYISVGMGIGAGVILGGQLYRGVHDLAGEIGHVTVDANGPQCECGNVGCLEIMAAIPGLYRQAAAIWRDEQVYYRELEELFDLTRYPGLARALRDYAVRYLSAGVINAINAYDPQRIILGGRVLDAGGMLSDNTPALLEEIRKEVQRRAFPVAAGRVDLVGRRLGPDATAIGAATLVIAELFSSPARFLQRSSHGPAIRTVIDSEKSDCAGELTSGSVV